MVEPVSDNILNLVNELYNNLDAKDKIINEQALEIASLQQRYNALLEAHKIQEELLEDKDEIINDNQNAKYTIQELIKTNETLIQENKQLKERINQALHKLKASVNHFKTQRENNAVIFTIKILGDKETPKGFKSYEDYKKKEEAFINHFCKGDKE